MKVGHHRRGRRRARGAPRRAAASATAPRRSTRTWRWRPPSSSCERDDHRASRPRRRSRTSSRRSARACSRSCPRWASRSSAPTRARRRSRPSASARSSSTSTSPARRACSAASGIDVIAAENAARHAARLPARTARRSCTSASQVGGEYQWRREGPPHLFNPDTVFRLQHSTRARRYDIFRDYTRLVDEQAENLHDPARAVQAQDRRAPAGPDRRGRAGRVDHHAVQHRCDELRLDQPGGARDARDRDEPHRRALEHGRGRRRRRPPARPRAPQRDQAGRVAAGSA